MKLVKLRGILPVLGMILLSIAIGGCGGSSTAPAAPTVIFINATPTTAVRGQWTTIQSFAGNGTKQTGVFQVGSNWRILWSCNPSSFSAGQYNIIIGVNNSDNSVADPAAINTICKNGNVSDSILEQQGGKVYLYIDSEGAWNVQVQVLK